MLFWIFVILFLIGLCLLFYSEHGCSYELYDFCYIGGNIATVISVCAIALMLLVITINHVRAEGSRLGNEQLYKSLIYKSNTEDCRDEFGIINKEYIDEVQNWNCDVVKYKQYQRDFWIGIFYPNIFDDFEIIDLETIKYREEK